MCIIIWVTRNSLSLYQSIMIGIWPSACSSRNLWTSWYKLPSYGLFEKGRTAPLAPSPRKFFDQNECTLLLMLLFFRFFQWFIPFFFFLFFSILWYDTWIKSCSAFLSELGRAVRILVWPHCSRSVRYQPAPNIFPYGPPTQSLNALYEKYTENE